LRAGAAACIAIGLPAFAAADFAREARWADEVVPGNVVGDAVFLATPSHSRVLAIYARAATAKGAVVVIHGAGVHPDWGLINGLRTGLAEAGFTTLSVQMPVLGAAAPARDYDALLPEAGERLGAAIAFLRAHGSERVAVVAHSLGAAMANAYLATAAPVAAFVPIGMQVPFATAPREPVLDIVAENDLPAVRAALSGRDALMPHDRCSGSAVIVGTDHFMANRQQELVSVVAAFLARAFAGDC
jgi:pimeloyl-ACP methyl ester carboxylesterase